jgi:hypothetical protein
MMRRYLSEDSATIRTLFDVLRRKNDEAVEQAKRIRALEEEIRKLRARE